MSGINVFTLASKIREPNEAWQSAIKRASAQRKGLPEPASFAGQPKKVGQHSECYSIPEGSCRAPKACHWVKTSKAAKGKTPRAAHCASNPIRATAMARLDRRVMGYGDE